MKFIVHSITTIEADSLEKAQQTWDDYGPEYGSDPEAGSFDNVDVSDARPTHTPSGFDWRWVDAINGTLADRDSDVVRIEDIEQDMWDRHLGPLVDAIEDEPLYSLDAPITSIEDALRRRYPPAVASPCAECPWRRDSASGWLGPYTADQWIEAVHSDAPIACHRTLLEGSTWKGASQCRGAASFRTHICKSPKNPTIATGPEDRARVFVSDVEFLAHHTKAGR